MIRRVAIADSVTSIVGRARRSPAGARARMAVAAPRLALRRDAAGRAIARAVRDASLGRLDDGDRAWARRIESRRETLLHASATTGPAFDPGTAGPEGRFSMERERTTVAIASAFMSLQRAWCVLLLRLVREVEPRFCLELGTGFGISGAYQAAGLELNGAGRLTTLEGSADWAELASDGFRELGLDERVDLLVGPIAETLRTLPSAAGPFELVFIDAEHQAEATVEHFDALAPRLAPGAVVVLDDLNWLPIREAWSRISADDRVGQAVAVGRLGFVVVAAEGRGGA